MTFAMRGRRALKPVFLFICLPAAVMALPDAALARGPAGASPGFHGGPSATPAGRASHSTPAAVVAPRPVHAPHRVAPTGVWHREPIAAGSFRPSPPLPPTFRPSATWPQQHFHFRRHRTGVAVIGTAPDVIPAPAEAPLEYTYAEPPLDAYVAPCAAPLIIRINGDVGPASAHGVRVVHASNSGCSAPQVVNARGAKIVQVKPGPVRSRY